jgi:hypothetical protein
MMIPQLPLAHNLDEDRPVEEGATCVCVAEKEKFLACRYFRAGKPKLSRQELTYHMHMVNRNEVIIVCCVCSARPVLASRKRKDSVCKATTGPGPLARDHQIRSNRLVLTSYFFFVISSAYILTRYAV